MPNSSKPKIKCRIISCLNYAKCTGFCIKHYRRYKKYGDPLAGPKFIEPSYGQGTTPLYKLWRGIITRCANPNSSSYKRYGGRGISIFEPWYTSFLAFKSYIEHTLGERPTGGILDRINNNGNYEPGNIKWSTKMESANNTSTNCYITYNKQTKTLIQWARELKINRVTLKNRIMSGWGVEEALTKPVEKYRKGTKPKIYSINGEARSLREWA